LALGWFVWGGFLGVLYLIAFITAGVMTIRNGHLVLFVLGFIFPLLWIIGAFMEASLLAGEDWFGLSRGPGSGFGYLHGGNKQIKSMKDLPPDLGALDDADLVVQRATRDARLAALFRRWPRLGGRELNELRRLYDERLRLARHFGRLRRGRG